MLDEIFDTNLAKTADINELKLFLKYTELSVPAQVALVARGDEVLIKLYISTYSLSEEAQCELIMPGKRELLLYALKKAPFSRKATRLLIGRFVPWF